MLKESVAAALVTIFSAVPASEAQMSVGNGSSIAPSAGQLEPYGVGDFEIMQSQGAFPSRHYRRGNNPGIGSSFLETSSPTSEGSPALNPETYIIQPMPVTQFRLPQLNNTFPTTLRNPSMESISPALPALPQTSALTSPITNPPALNSADRIVGPQSLPSLGNQRSAFDQHQFDEFDNLMRTENRTTWP